MDDEKITNMFAVAAPAKGGVAAMEKREETEVFAMVMMAKRFPRVQADCMDRILNAFARPTLAEVSQYQFARGGTDITGPSIRAAEAIAQEWGNLDTGWKEVDRGIDAKGIPYSVVQAYCIDLQSTNRKALQFMVPHWRDTKSGGYKLKDERDIYELCANQAQRRLRQCILANIPGDVIEMAMKQAGTTLNTHADVSPEAQKKLLETFEKWGVTKEHIEARIQRRLDAITPAQMVQMKRIYVSLRDDMSTAAEWFDMPEATPRAGDTTSLGDLEKRATPAPTPAPGPATDLAGTPVADKGAPKPPEPDALIAKIKAAKNMDALETWGQWISPASYPDEAVRLKLGEHYEARRKELAP